MIVLEKNDSDWGRPRWAAGWTNTPSSTPQWTRRWPQHGIRALSCSVYGMDVLKNDG